MTVRFLDVFSPRPHYRFVYSAVVIAVHARKIFRVDVEVEIIPKSLGGVPGENTDAEPFPAKKLDWLIWSL